MSGPIYDIQAALVSALTGDATLRTMLGQAHGRTFTAADVPVFGGPPTNQAFPYVTLNLVAATDFDHSDRFGRDALFDVHAWARGQSHALAHQLADRIVKVVREITTTGRPTSLVMIRTTSTRLVVEDDGLTHQVVSTFRALAQE